MSVTLWYAIIIAGISITSLHASLMTTLIMRKPRGRQYHLLASSASSVCLNVEKCWPGFANKGRGTRETRHEQARIHQQTSRARETSQQKVSVSLQN